jgi:hypothetical protein
MAVKYSLVVWKTDTRTHTHTHTYTHAQRMRLRSFKDTILKDTDRFEG